MGAQTTVTVKQAEAFAGMIADSGPHDTRSFYNEEGSAEIAFGLMAARGTTDEDEGALLPHTSAAAMASAFLGPVVHAHSYSKPLELGDTGLKPGVSLGILRKGRMWVTVEDAVTPGDPVRVRVLAGAGTVGAFRTAADASNCVDISAFASFLTTAGAGELAQVEVDMTAPAGTAD